MARSRGSARWDIDARDRTRAGTSSAARNFDALAVTIRGVGTAAALAGTATLGVAGAIIRQNADVIDSYGKLSEKLGISVSSYQAINDAAERAGIAQNTLNTSLQRSLRRTSEAAAGTGEAVKAFDELGISAIELQQLAPEERLFAILDAIQQLSDEGDKVRLASKLFDSEGVDLVRLFTSNIEGARQEIADLGLTLTELDVEAVEAMNDEIQRVQRNASEAGKVFTGEMAPAIQAIVGEIGDMGTALLGSREAAEVFSDALITGVSFAGERINDIRRTIVGLSGAYLDFVADAGRLVDRIPGLDLDDEIQRVQIAADRLVGLYGEIPDPGEFSAGLAERLEANRLAAEAAAAAIETSRRGSREPITLAFDIDATGTASSVSGAVDGVRQRVVQEFDTLLDTLQDGSASYESAYRARLEAADRLRTEFPERAGEALQAEIAALEERNSVLERLGRGAIDLGVDVTGGSDELVEQLAADTQALREQLAARNSVLGADVPVVQAPDVEASNDAVDSIRAANDDLIRVADERDAVVARLIEPRVVVGIDLTDGADQAADQLAAGTDRLLIETRVRGDLLEALDAGTSVQAGVQIEDGAPAAADSIDASTQTLIDAAERRDRILSALASSANDASFGVQVDFDIQFPEFSTATSEASRQLEEDLAVIAGYRQRFPDEIERLAEAEALAYARRDQAVADAIGASNDAIAQLQAPIQQDVSALEQSLQSDVQAIEAAYVERVNVVRNGILAEVLAEEEGTARLVAARAKRAEDLEALEEAAAARRARGTSRLINNAETVFGSLLQLQEQEVGGFIELNERMSAEERKRAIESNRRNRERFEDNKQYQQGQAFINMLAGISQVIADPTLSYYEKIGASAATAAQGAVLISRIRSAEFGGSGAAPGLTGGSAGGGSSPGSAPDTRLADSLQGNSQAQGSQPIIIVSGDSTLSDAQIESQYVRAMELAKRSRRVRYPNGAEPAITQFQIERVA